LVLVLGPDYARSIPFPWAPTGSEDGKGEAETSRAHMVRLRPTDDAASSISSRFPNETAETAAGFASGFASPLAVATLSCCSRLFLLGTMVLLIERDFRSLAF
jgi:hypothetical protein